MFLTSQHSNYLCSEWRVSPDHTGAAAVAGRHHGNHQGGGASGPACGQVRAADQVPQVPGAAQGPPPVRAQGGLAPGGCGPARATGNFTGTYNILTDETTSYGHQINHGKFHKF